MLSLYSTRAYFYVWFKLVMVQGGAFGVYSFVVAGLLTGFALLSIAEHANNLHNERKESDEKH